MTAVDRVVLDDRYELDEVIGRGGMAQVFRARDTVLDRPVAIKVFHQDGVLPDGDVRRSGEVRLVAGLSHPGLVTVFDAGRDESNPLAPFAYLVMELVEGQTLADLLRNGPLPPYRAAQLGAQLAGALSYVHASGIVHRDLKPANVLLAADGSAKLTDFGVARLVDSTRLTMDGSTVGTANYLSPEQASCVEVEAPSDIYSLGLVLLECLTGEVAYPGHGVAAAAARLHRQPVVPAWVDEPWRDLITAMTAFAPDDRPDAATVAVRLQVLAMPLMPTVSDSQPITPFLPPAPVGSGRRRHRTRSWIAAAVAAATAIAAITLAMTSGNAGPTPAALTYPVVAGKLGTDLHELEGLAPSQLADDVLAVARRCAVSDYPGARRALATLASDLGDLLDQGTIGDDQHSAIARALATVSADVARKQATITAAKRSAAAQAAARAAAARRASAAARAAAARVAARKAAAAQARADALAAARRAAARAAAARHHHHAKPHGDHHDHGHGHGHHHGHGDD